MKKCIYTVLIGNYDTILPAPKFERWDSILFTDQDLDHYKGWTARKVENDSELGDKKLSRKYKILSHIYLSEYDLVCYIDSNMELKQAPPDEPVFFNHPIRRTVMQEITALIRLKKEDANLLKIQFNKYRKAGFKDNIGLWCNGFFVRNNKEKTINTLFETWWTEVRVDSYRDQVSLPFSLYYQSYKLPSKPYRIAQQYIKIHPHQPHTINVHHITPGRADKNFGKAINDIVKLLPDNDWICLRDIDTIPPNHEQFFQQCEELAKNKVFGLIGCMTNRLGLKWQLHKGEFSEDMDMNNHRYISIELSEKYGSEIKQSMSSIGGLFMLFPKSTWLKVGGFPEGKIMIKGRFIDYHFWESVKKKGIKVGIAKGLYIFHHYRNGKDKKDIKHLI